MSAGSVWVDIPAGRLVGVQLDRLAGLAPAAGITHRQPADRNARPHRRDVPQRQGLARHDLGLGHHRLHLEAEAALQDPIEEPALLVHHAVGRARSPSRLRSASNAGTLAAGSFGLNCAMIASACRPTSAPPGTRPQVVSTPSRMSLVAGSPPRSWNDSVRGPPPPGRRSCRSPGTCASSGSARRSRRAARPRPGRCRRSRSARTPAPAPPPASHRRRGRIRRCSGGCASAARASASLSCSGNALRVAGELERLEGQYRRRRVVPVSAALGRESRDDDVGPERPDDPDDIGQHLLPVPDSQGLAGTLGEAEVDRAGEELPAAVEPPRGQQFLGPDHPELFEELGTEHVLPAVAAGQREVGRAVVAAAGQIGDQLGVLIVGMGGDVEHAAHLAKTAQVLQQADAAIGSSARLLRSNVASMHAPATRNGTSQRERPPDSWKGSRILMGIVAAETRTRSGREAPRLRRYKKTERKRAGASSNAPAQGDAVEDQRPLAGALPSRLPPPLNERREATVRLRYFLTVNGTEYSVVSHIILITPPPEGPFSMAIVNWSTGLSRVSFLRSTRPSSLAASFFSS